MVVDLRLGAFVDGVGKEWSVERVVQDDVVEEVARVGLVKVELETPVVEKVELKRVSILQAVSIEGEVVERKSKVDRLVQY